ncbi:MAG: FixH family protein [Candidatus Kapaibacterium sp.]
MASKFKFNWGTGIAIFYISFVVAVLSFVFWTTGNNRELVTENYYAEELVYQKIIDSKNRANSLEGKVKIDAKKGVINVMLPEGMNNKLVNGELFLFRQDDKHKDTKFRFEGEKTDFTFNSDKIVLGRWKAKLSWVAEGVDYYFEDNLWIK